MSSPLDGLGGGQPPKSGVARYAVTPTTPQRICITAPETGLALLRDPEAPVGRSTIALEAVVDPPSQQVLWYVDGIPFSLTDHPYTTRWPIEAGTHTFQARVPFTDARSNVVRIRVF
jgi:penicillin-binding protein 1C